jgi:hypothetical protein
LAYCLKGPYSLTPAATLTGGQHDQAAGFQTIEQVAGSNILELARRRPPIPSSGQFLG